MRLEIPGAVERKLSSVSWDHWVEPSGEFQTVPEKVCVPLRFSMTNKTASSPTRLFAASTVCSTTPTATVRSSTSLLTKCATV